jgi:hypothetical protein
LQLIEKPLEQEEQNELPLPQGGPGYETVPRDPLMQQRPLELPLDFPLLEDILRRWPSIRTILIDPIHDMCHSAAEIRETLRQLNLLTQRIGITVLVTTVARSRFTRIGKLRSSSMFKCEGVRAVWCVVEDPNDPSRRLFVPRLNSSFVSPTGFSFRIHPSQVAWNVRDEIDPEDPLMLGGSIREFLTELLAPGPQPAGAVFDHGARHGFRIQQLRDVAARMGVQSLKAPVMGAAGYWLWALPAGEAGALLRKSLKPAESSGNEHDWPEDHGEPEAGYPHHEWEVVVTPIAKSSGFDAEFDAGDDAPSQFSASFYRESDVETAKSSGICTELASPATMGPVVPVAESPCAVLAEVEVAKPETAKSSANTTIITESKPVPAVRELTPEQQAWRQERARQRAETEQRRKKRKEHRQAVKKNRRK